MKGGFFMPETLNIYTRLINKAHPLPSDYIPLNLIDSGIPFDAPAGDPKRLMEKKGGSRSPAACAGGL